MRKVLPALVVLIMANLFSIAAHAQNATIKGTVKAATTQEILASVSIVIKGTGEGTYTDEKGNFTLVTSQKLPLTLEVSAVGYATQSVEITASGQAVTIVLAAAVALGQDVVVSATRVAERILESPVSVERVSAMKIRTSAATSYYDIIGNQKGVDIMASSLTFKTPSTRGYVGSGNLRLNQIVDGMDNQAPGLNFSVGSIVGITDLDVDNMELLAGASSALYGPGGMNGTLLINSKDPFKYQGLSVQIREGYNHVDNYQRDRSLFNDISMRWAKKIGNNFAFKVSGQYVRANDWEANDDRNYTRGTKESQNGNVIPGNRQNDPNYDGVNVYGDETTQSLASIASQVMAAAGLPAQLLGAANQFLTANPQADVNAFNAFLTAIGGGAAVQAGISPIIYGNSPARNYFNGQNVSRTGYAEKDVINPKTDNFKVNVSLHYKISNAIEVLAAGYFGSGNSVYTGSDRYSLKDFTIGQYKVELKHRNWFVRGYMTMEDAGKSFNSTITTRLFNEGWKPSTAWYPQYMGAYATALSMGADPLTAHGSGRTFADQGRPTGHIGDSELFNKVASTPISQGGGKFLDKSNLYNVEAQYNLSEDLKIKNAGWDVLIGGNWKTYVLNSQGTLFADTAGKINITELGAYLQVQKKLFKDHLKLSASGRYDKNSNFKGRFTPRASAVVTVAKNHNIRLSYQTAYRFPSTQNQWINLLVSGGIRLMGGLPELRDYYKFGTNPAYTQASVQAFGASALAGQPDPTLLQEQKFGEFKPESSTSYELGYKGLVADKLLIDVYGYMAEYKDFLGTVVALQAKTPGDVVGLLGGEATRTVYSISVNTSQKVKSQGWGISLEYLLPKNFSFTANVFSDELKNAPDKVTFATYFNSPKYRTNIGLTNSGFLFKNRLGGSLNFRWQDSFYYEGTFGAGMVPAFSTFDGMISFKILKSKSLIKIGGTNLFNKYYRSGWGNPQIGALYYASLAINVL